MKKNKSAEEKVKKTEEEIFKAQQERLFKFAKEIRKEEKRRERRRKIALAIANCGPYFIGVLWLTAAALGSLESSEGWVFDGIIGSIWILIGVVNSK